VKLIYNRGGVSSGLYRKSVSTILITKSKIMHQVTSDFGSSGGGEIYAISPVGSVVCLAFGSMSASEALYVASSSEAFEAMLRPES
jgi:hypothetical protein